MNFDLANLAKKKSATSKSSGQGKSAAKPNEQKSDGDGHKSPGNAATPTPKTDPGKKPEAHITVDLKAFERDQASDRAAGVLLGTLMSMMPGGFQLMEEASIKGASSPITADQRLGIASGEMLGGAVQLIGSIGLFGGGAVVTTTGAGAIVGAPAMALSVGLASTGALNIWGGVKNLVGALNAMSSGGGGGVAQGPAAPAQAPKPKKGGENAATKAGREAHEKWDPGPGFEKEVGIPGRMRADAINRQTREVKELKPNNPAAIQRGHKQVEKYRQKLEETTGESWTDPPPL